MQFGLFGDDPLIARLIGYGIAAVIAAVLLLAPLAAQAQAPLCPRDADANRPCVPGDGKPECGPLLKGTTATGQWEAYWWVASKTETNWWWCRAQWAMLDKYDPKDPRKVMQIANAIFDGPQAQLPQRIKDAITLYGIKPPPGSQDEYDFLLLHHAACQALQAAPPPSWSSGGAPAPCVAPTPPPPPPPPTIAWEVIPDGTKPTRAAFPAIQDAAGKWKRASISSNVQVPALTTCDCQAIDIFEFNITHYCRVPAEPAPQVSACRVRR